MLRSRQEQRHVTQKWEELQQEKEREENKKKETFGVKVQQHCTWVGQMQDDIRVREKQVNKVIDKWEGISRNGIVAQAYKGELKYGRKKKEA